MSLILLWVIVKLQAPWYFILLWAVCEIIRIFNTLIND